MGLIFPSAIPFAPKGTDYCAGQTYSIQQNTALFSLLGTIFGGDGSSTFKLPDLRGRVPVGIGSGGPVNLNFQMGAVGGFSATTLTQAQMPSHNHPASFTAVTGSTPITITVGSGGTGLNASVGGAGITASLAVSTGGGTLNAPNSNAIPAVVPGVGGEQVSAYGAPAGSNSWPVTGTTNAQSAPVNGTISSSVSGVVTGGAVTVGTAGGSNPLPLMQPYLGLAFLIATEGLYPPRP
jgi:microcystin-dependent protein